MQCVKHEASFCHYYDPKFSFPEQSHRDTCYPRDLQPEYADNQYSTNIQFIDSEIADDLDRNVVNNFAEDNFKTNPNMWMKKPRPNQRGSSPRKYNRPIKQYTFQNIQENIAPQRNISPSKRRSILSVNETQNNQGNSNFDFIQSRMKVNESKGRKTYEEPVIWSLPPENKKLQ